MNEFVDMHVHSKFSIDGMSTMEDYCLIAGKTGTRVICFTEHVDFNSAEKNLSIVKDNRKQNFVVDDYFREINRLRKKYGSLTLLSGIEFSEPSLFPEEFALYSSYPFDCITAGIHHCYNSVFPGAGNLSVSKAIYEYYQIMQKTVELGGFQVLAHLDFPKLFFDKWVIDDDVLDMILSTMIDKNILLEVNTSSLNDSCDEPMPSYSVINRYVQLGGNKIVIGSDAHSSDRLSGHFRDDRERLCYSLECFNYGFEFSCYGRDIKISTYSNRRSCLDWCERNYFIGCYIRIWRNSGGGCSSKYRRSPYVLSCRCPCENHKV